jgi:hypothetical protein
MIEYELCRPKEDFECCCYRRALRQGRIQVRHRFHLFNLCISFGLATGAVIASLFFWEVVLWRSELVDGSRERAQTAGEIVLFSSTQNFEERNTTYYFMFLIDFERHLTAVYE